MRRLATLLLVLLSLSLAACGDEEAPKDEAASPATETQAEKPACKDVQAPEPKPDGGQERPKDKLDPAKSYGVEILTSCGSFTIELNQKASPATTASFASLAREGFFDNTVFHRIVPGFVIQGGDPTGTGTGGPGYKTVDKPPAGTAYTEGVVAMAKSADEAPGTSGSQFYVVTGAEAPLPPDYALLGKVTEGLDVVLRIGELGDPATEMPLQPVVVEKATLREG